MYFHIFTGGLATVIYLDTLMAFVMVGGAAIMTFIGKKSHLIYKPDLLRPKGLLMASMWKKYEINVHLEVVSTERPEP